MIRVFYSKAIVGVLTQEELKSLIDDFKSYKAGASIPVFGRDVPYDCGHNLPLVRHEDVRHIHLLSDEQQGSIHQLQFYKTSDTHLVYCRGFTDPDRYLLIAILSPNAHEQARSNDVMYKIGEMAKSFRSKH